jgi:hypothetical protein
MTCPPKIAEMTHKEMVPTYDKALLDYLIKYYSTFGMESLQEFRQPLDVGKVRHQDSASAPSVPLITPAGDK